MVNFASPTFKQVTADVSPSSVLASGGTTERSLAAVLSDSINVKSFGATGNGATNDQSAVNAAQAYASSVGAPVFYPPGNYNLNGGTAYESPQPLGIGYCAQFPNGNPLGAPGLFSGHDFSVWRMLDAASGNECVMQVGAMGQPTATANPNYQKNVFQVFGVQQDDSTTNTHDMVSIYASAQAQNNLTQGRIWAANFAVSETAGSSALMTGLEIDLYPQTPQTILNTYTSKTGLSVFNLGSVAATTGIVVGGSNKVSGPAFQFGLLFNNADNFGAALWGGYASNGSWTSWVDNSGSAGLNALQIGGTLPTGNSPTFPAQTSGVLSVTSATTGVTASFYNKNTGAGNGLLIQFTEGLTATPTKYIQIAGGKFNVNNSANTTNLLQLDDNGLLTINNSSTETLALNNTTNGVVIGLNGNGSTTPSKYLTVINGALNINNSANTTNILTLSDAGSLNVAGNYKISGIQVVGAQISGYGTPTGASRISSFPGASATLAQCSEMIAQIVSDLKTHGLFGA